MKEVELAQKFVEYLKDSYDLYYEVRDVDIIGKAGNILIGVEVKTSLNFKVIEQAYANRTMVNYSYIAVLWSRNSDFQHKICKVYGIGVLSYRDTDGRVREEVKPLLQRRAYTKWFKPHPDLKRSKPGSPSGTGVISAFNITVENIERYVRRHPGCTIKEVFGGIDCHYESFSSMRGSIYKYIHGGIIPTIKIENIEGTYRLYFKQTI